MPTTGEESELQDGPYSGPDPRSVEGPKGTVMGEKKVRQRWERPAEETMPALREQIGFLRRSCRHYDDGIEAEAIRLAVAVWVIASDAGQISLITRLGIRRSLNFVETAPPDIPGNMIQYMPLLGARVKILETGAAGSYVPLIPNPSGAPRPARFVDWWERNLIYDDRHGGTLTRRKVVSALRNQDNGGHFDGGLDDEVYVRLSRQNAGGMTFSINGNPAQEFPPGAHLAIMRVIAYEIEKTLVDGGLVAGPTQSTRDEY